MVGVICCVCGTWPTGSFRHLLWGLLALHYLLSLSAARTVIPGFA